VGIGPPPSIKALVAQILAVAEAAILVFIIRLRVLIPEHIESIEVWLCAVE